MPCCTDNAVLWISIRAAKTATQNHASPGARCAPGFLTGSAVTARATAEMTTTTVMYGKAVRSRCARVPDIDGEDRLFRPISHTVAQTVATTRAIGTERLLAR